MRFLWFFGLVISPGYGGKFWHISDLHLDYEYSLKGDINSMCHKNESAPSTSDLSPAGNYNCDAPPSLVFGILKAMKKLEPDPDFIVWTGDSSPHLYTPYPDYKYITKVTRTVFKKISNLFNNTPVIAALGNHDSYPADSYDDFKNSTGNKTSQYYKYYYQGGFGEHIDEGPSTESFLRCGYYTKTVVRPATTLKFIVLNTNLYYNNVANISEADPCDQLAWLNQTLLETGPHEKVYIVAHVPPGTFERQPTKSFFNSPPEYAEDIEKNYVSLLVQPGIHEKIQAHLYGHVHTDSFRLFLSMLGDDEVRGVGFLASSVTPLLWENPGVNPGMRLFNFKEETGTLSDYSQYGLLLDQFKPNLKLKSRRKELTEGSPDRGKREARPSERGNSRFLNLTSTDPPSNTSSSTNSSAEPPSVLPTESSVDAVTTTTSSSKTEAVTTLLPSTKLNSTELRVATAQKSKAKTNLGKKDENPAQPLGSEVSLEASKLIENNNSSSDTFIGASLADAEDEDIDAKDKKNPDEANSDDSKIIGSIADSFQLIYKATEAFNITDLSAGEMAKAYNSMNVNSSVFTDYYKHNTNNHKHNDGVCNGTCYRSHMCTIKYQIFGELKRCLNGSDSLKVSLSPVPADGSADGRTAAGTTSTPTTPAPLVTTSSTSAPTTTVHIPLSTRVTEKTTKGQMPAVEDYEESHDYPDSKDVDITHIESGEGRVTSKIAGTILGVFGALVILLVAGILVRRYRQRRSRDQEFLLTDAVFRYDGYSQLDDTF